ncbi:MAG: MATE family efflux transporter [Spirochaetales bacterium]|nr:MATE family efflux transporter [Spirochaetales bacterium]
MIKKPGILSFRSMLTIAMPLVISKGSETVMLFTDRAFLSFLGQNHISAAMSGGLSAFVFSSFFAGVISYVNALAAQYHGAKQPEQSMRSAHQGIWLALFSFPLCLALIPFVHGFFLWAGHTQEQLVLEFSYYRILTFGSLFSFFRASIEGYFIGTGQTRKVMGSNILGMVINIPLNYILIFGHLGFPAMGIEGAAIGSILGNATCSVYLLLAFVKAAKKMRLPVFGPIRSGIFKKLLRYGLPAGGELFFNVFLFNFFIQMMHSINPTVAVATTITFNYNMIAFIPLLGLSFAITSMTGQQMGASSVEGAKKVAKLAAIVTYGYGLFMVVTFLIGTPLFVKLFLGGVDPKNSTIPELSVTMLRLATIYIMADGTQLLFSGVLRGAGDTRWVMYISMSLHIIMASGAYIMIKVLKQGPLTVWYFFIAFVFALGLAMFLRFLSGHWQKIKMIDEASKTMTINPE